MSIRPQAGDQVRERHVRALYVNVPVPEKWLQKQLTPPAVPDVFGGSAWISIVIDDLSKLQTPMFGRFVTVPGMNGWMMKVNALVRCVVVSGQPPVAAYQILTLDFEASRGISAWVKKRGALSTQKIPTFISRFDVSCGSFHSLLRMLNPLDVFSTKSGQVLFETTGHFHELDGDDSKFVQFVVSRPHKLLSQRPTQKRERGSENSRRLVYGSWREGYTCSAEGCVKFVSDHAVDVEAVFKRTFTEDTLRALNPKSTIDHQLPFIFLQPEYIMVDTKNTPVPVPSSTRDEHD